MNFFRARNTIYELGKRPVEPLPLVPKLGLIPLVFSVVWTALFAWFVGRSIGWLFVTQLFAHEIGGLIAGFIAPPAAIFALAAMFANNKRTRDTVLRLEAQVARLATPQAEAEAGLVDLGEEMRGYASTLEHTVDHARTQLDQLGAEYTERINALSAASDTAVENSRAQLEYLGTEFTERVQALSVFLLPTSYFLLPTSYFLLPTSYFLLLL